MAFTRNTEKWVGRVAIIGQLCGIARGFSTGQGILQQLGATPSVPLAMSLSAVGCSLISLMTVTTMLRYTSGDLTLEELQGYCNFFEGVPMPAYLRTTFLNESGDSASSVDALVDTSDSPSESDSSISAALTQEQKLERYTQSLIYLPDTEVDRMFAEREEQEIATLEAIGARAAMLWFVTSVGIEAFKGIPVEDQVTRFLAFLATQ